MDCALSEDLGRGRARDEERRRSARVRESQCTPFSIIHCQTATNALPHNFRHIRKNPDTYESESLKHLKRVRKVPKPDDQNAGSRMSLT